jgi:low temperature requirement protein LtrA
VPIVTYAYAHLPLLAALMYVAGGVSILVRSEAQPAAGAWALCAGVAVFLASLSIAHAQLVAPVLRWVTAARWLSAGLVLFVPLLVETAVEVTGLTLGVLVTLVVFEGVMCKPAEHSAADQTASRFGSTK